ncbi:uncharacterized protein LOC127247761 [Andrographis paniculata]|uniref:uncharacterized protein LOC127247761 n=1 Tax=Andrographis paniculata TaxID=175694 RepID=UPI0021E94DE1|nr:uncharacterized protein LOC127247761 [Andrographis paniculata]
MDEIVARIVSDLEAQVPLSLSFFEDFESLLDYSRRTCDPIDLENLYNELSARNLSLISLVNAISSSMDSSLSCRNPILASKVYQLLLLSPNSPVFTLFTPMAFLNLHRVIRLAVKHRSLVSKDGSRPKKARRNVGGKDKRVGNVETVDNDGEEGSYDVKDLFCLLELLEQVLHLVHLDRFSDCLKALVQTISEITMNAAELWENLGNFNKLCRLCSQILLEILKAEHGIQGDTAAEVLKALAPLILSSKQPLRSFALDFVRNCVVGIGKSSDDIMKAVANMPKYLVWKAPEKAEHRAFSVNSIMEIVKALDFEYQAEFADYVVKLSQGKGQVRLLSVDLIVAFLTTLSGPFGFEMVDGDENPWGFRLLKALIQRCSDYTAVVRARALSNLAQAVTHLSENDKSRTVVKEIIEVGIEDIGGVNKFLKLRCMDEKAAVRKAALFLISKLTSLLGGELDEELLKTVGMCGSDPLVSIRKVAISALSEAFRKHSSQAVIKEWMHSIPRLITDNETSIQEECENLFLELVLDRVSQAGSRSGHYDSFPGDMHSKSSDSDLRCELYPEGVLGLLKEIFHEEVSPWVKKICSSLGKKKKLKTKIATALQNIIRTSESQWLNHSMAIEKWTAPPGAWFLLSEVSAFLSKSIDWEFLHHHWQLLDKYKPPGDHPTASGKGYIDDEMVDAEFSSVAWVTDRVYLLQTISNVSMVLPPEPAAELAQNFLSRLEAFNMHSTEVNAHVKALKTLCMRKALNPEEADMLVMRWVNQLLSKASQVLEAYMSKISDASKDRSLFTPQTAPSCIESKLLAQAISAVYTIGSLVIACQSINLNTVVPAIHAIITSGSSNRKSTKISGPVVPVKQVAPPLYIQAWLTMGKICLSDGKLAKRYLPLFVQELETSSCAALRNNIVVMMQDFCVRYTAMVDCYLPKITKCLQDPCEPVRRQTFIQLSRLLQRDYVKWRGVLFFRFLICLVDESEKIRQLADFVFGNILKAKAPLLAYNSFVESIFVLNDCNAHTGRSNSNSSRSENRLFTLRGNNEKSRSQRMHIYSTLLKEMAPEHLLTTFAKVCTEVLGAASDGMLSIEDTTGQSVLQDAFLVLSSKEMRIQSSNGSSSSEPADVEEDGGGGAMLTSAASKGRAITQALRKGLIQSAIPTIIELKRLLESKNSPLIGSLMDCLRILLKDYKNEIDDFLVADRQLHKELVYDMQKYESMKAKTAASDAVASMKRSEAFWSPLPNNAKKIPNNSKVASAMADARAAATARSVLREVNNGVSTPLSAMSVPKLKSRVREGGDGAAGQVLESLRRRQTFDSDGEN